MINKRCTLCKAVKPLSSFYKWIRGHDGYTSHCKDCIKSYYTSEHARKLARKRAKKYYYVQGGREYNRRYYRSDRGKEVLCKFRKSLKGKKSQAREYARKRKLGLDKIYKLVAKELPRSPCEVCGKTIGVHAHHDDYSKPLLVRWLCARHHMQIHKPKKIIVLGSAHDVE